MPRCIRIRTIFARSSGASSQARCIGPDTVRAILATGVEALIECGPGKVLTGLNRRIERRADLACLALEDPAAIDSALARSAGAAHA